MRLVITKERHFVRGADNRVYTDNEQASGYSILRRYLDVFSELTLVGRLHEGSAQGLSEVAGPGISFVAVPDYVGPVEYLRKKSAIRAVFRDLVQAHRGTSAFVARCPGTLATEMIGQLRQHRHPYGIELVGDPYDVFAPGSVRHPLRPLFRWIFPRELQGHCRGAAAIAYVTESLLQRRYPAAPGVFTTHYSSIHLEEEAFVDKPREVHPKEAWQLVFVGTLAQLYKAPDVLIDAIGLCLQRGLKVNLRLVGDGMFRTELEKRAASWGEHIVFPGRLPAGEAIRNELDRADLFILPSKGEGLPRAMIEAMARALPCIGTSVSGIPELLPPEDLVPAGDADALARKIAEVLADPQRMNRMAQRNLKKAEDYRLGLLRQRRIALYREVYRKTEEYWKTALAPGSCMEAGR